MQHVPHAWATTSCTSASSPRTSTTTTTAASSPIIITTTAGVHECEATIFISKVLIIVVWVVWGTVTFGGSLQMKGRRGLFEIYTNSAKYIRISFTEAQGQIYFFLDFIHMYASSQVFGQNGRG